MSSARRVLCYNKGVLTQQKSLMQIKIAPSLLSADFGRFNEEIATIADVADMAHVDIMDGHFVPNITFGAPVVGSLKCPIPMDVHLMIEHPEKYLEDFARAVAKARGIAQGADGSLVADKESYLTVHVEACTHLHRVIQQIKSLGMKAAVALNPATSLSTIEAVLDDVDMILIMSVNPGFGGQSFIESSLAKIRALRALRPNLDIQVDGGVNDKTAPLVKAAGATILVAGSYVFGATNRKEAIEKLRA